LKAALQAPPAEAGIEVANWNWKVVRTFLAEHFGEELSRSSCLNYLHRLDFVWKRPKKHLLKADATQRTAFVAFYHALRQEAATRTAKIFFVDEAIFRADADLRGKWVLKGESALVDSTSPSRSVKVVYYSGVCLETGAVEEMEVAGNCTAETSAAFLRQLVAHQAPAATSTKSVAKPSNAVCRRASSGSRIGIRNHIRCVDSRVPSSAAGVGPTTPATQGPGPCSSSTSSGDGMSRPPGRS